MTNISNANSDVATEKTNVTGVLTPILEIDPEDGTTLVVKNGVERGQQSRGVPIYAILEDSNGDPLPRDTEVAIEFQGPTDDKPSVVSVPRQNIRPYNSLTIQEQQNTEYVDRVKHVLNGEALVIEDVETAYVSIESSEQIDWSNSRLQFDESAVVEV